MNKFYVYVNNYKMFLMYGIHNAVLIILENTDA